MKLEFVFLVDHWACYTHEEINLNSSCTQFCGQSCEKVISSKLFLKKKLI